MATGTKRDRPADWDTSQIEISEEACVHEVIVDVSPVKRSRKNDTVRYFHSELTDGKKIIKVVSFDPSLQSVLKDACEKVSTISLSKCQVKPSRDNPEQLEILLSPCSKVDSSPRKFSVNRQLKFTPDSKTINLEDIGDISVNQIVSVRAKVTEVQEPKVITTKHGKQLTKQDVTIADQTESSRIVHWEEDVGSLEVEKSYYFKNVGVRQYANQKFLSMAPASSKNAIDDIGEVLEDANDERGSPSIDGEIDSVFSLTDYRQCKVCNSNIEIINDIIGRCTKCLALSKLSKCPVTSMAKVIISDNLRNKHTLTIFQPILSQHTWEKQHGDQATYGSKAKIPYYSRSRLNGTRIIGISG